MEPVAELLTASAKLLTAAMFMSPCGASPGRLHYKPQIRRLCPDRRREAASNKAFGGFSQVLFRDSRLQLRRIICPLYGTRREICPLHALAGSRLSRIPGVCESELEMTA